MKTYMKVSQARDPLAPVESDTMRLEQEFTDRWDNLNDRYWGLRDRALLYRERLQGNTTQRPDYSYPENLSGFEKENYELYRDLLQLLNDFGVYEFLQPDEQTRGDIEWMLRSYEESQTRDVHLIGNNGIHYNANIAQRFIFQSSEFLGLPFFILFIFFFAGLYAAEHERGTLDLLHMQPTDRTRIFSAKLGVMMFSALLYLLLLLVIQLLVASYIGLPFGGFSELYRVFMSDHSVRWLSGHQLFFRIVVAFPLLTFFFSNLLLYISSRLRNTVLTLAVILFIFGLNYALVKNVPQFQSSFHPIFQLDYLRVLLGKQVHESTGTGMLVSVSKAASGLLPYFSLLIPSVAFFFMTRLPQHEKREKTKEQKTARSFFGLECKKIHLAQSFTFYLVGGIILLAILFIFPVIEDGVLRELESLDRSPVESAQTLYEAMKGIITNDETDDFSSSDDDRSSEENALIDEQLQIFVDRYEAALGRFNAFRTGDAETYYLNTLYIHELKEIGYSDNGFVAGHATDKTHDEMSAILAQAAETDDPLVPFGAVIYPNYSAREDYKTSLDRERIQRQAPPSHSAVFWPYRLLSRLHFDVILLLIMALITFIGYTLDKEDGNQIEFLVTQPLSKARLHLTKLAAGMTMGTLLLTCYLAFATLCGLITEGIGAYRFPIVFYAGQDFTLIPLWQYLLMTLGALLSQAFFLNSLMLLLSVAIHKRVTLMGWTAFIMGFGIVGTALLPEGFTKTLSPFNYFEASNLANQAVRYYNDIPDATYGLGLTTLVIFGLLFTLVGVLLVSKREFKSID